MMILCKEQTVKILTNQRKEKCALLQLQSQRATGETTPKQQSISLRDSFHLKMHSCLGRASNSYWAQPKILRDFTHLELLLKFKKNFP